MDQGQSIVDLGIGKYGKDRAKNFLLIDKHVFTNPRNQSRCNVLRLLVYVSSNFYLSSFLNCVIQHLLDSIKVFSIDQSRIVWALHDSFSLRVVVASHRNLRLVNKGLLFFLWDKDVIWSDAGLATVDKLPPYQFFCSIL